MRRKQILRNLAWSVLTAVFAFVGATLFNVQPVTVDASQDTGIVNLYTPTATGENYTVGGFGDWTQETAVEDYQDSPSGKVLHHKIDNTESAGGETWPALTVSIPYTGDASNFAGYIVWLEYEGEMYSDSSYWGLFNFTLGSESNTVNASKPITFIDENGKINETKTNRWCYHHNNYTEIPDSGYTYAYSYSFKGYMLIPAESFSGTYTPAAERVMKFSHHYKKTITMDLKIGEIGFYTDYNAVLSEIGRCTYSFVDTDGTVVKTESVRPGSVVTAPEYSNSYTKDGKVYTLVGWSGYMDGMTISSDVTFNASYKVSDFHMVKGASIRTNEGSSGIRFTAEFDENLYNEVSLDENKEFGMVITKYDYYQAALETNEDLVKGLESLGANKYILITESSKNPLKPYEYIEETTRTYRINGAITNIKYSHADWKWIGVGVVITKTDAGNSYLYCAHDVESSARSAAYVASAALNNPAEDFDNEQIATVKNYVYQTAAKASGVSETEYNAAADKSVYLKGYSLEINGGLNTSYKFNQNVAGKEAYLEIGKPVDLSAVVTNSLGNVLDVAYTLSVSDEGILKVDGTTVTALKNGYATLTMSCELFGYSETVTVYTGSEDAGNAANARVKWYTEASNGKAVSGEIDGQKYSFELYRNTEKSPAGSYMYAAYSNISVYYIDYLLSQGYQYLRIPFYFDTTRYEELGGTAEQVTNPYITIWVANGLYSGSGASKVVYVPANEWCYYDMDLMHYRMNYVRADGTGVNEYGLRNSRTSADTYHYINMKFSCAYGFVYTSDMTFIKDSVIEVDESNDSVSFGETVNLAERYATKEAVKYFVDGVEMDSFVALNSEHKIEIKANLYTAKIGDGSYTVGSTVAWAPNYTAVDAIAKTFSTENGMEVISTVLVDVKDGMDVSTSLYTQADVLKESGFNVTETYVKRYSDQTVQNSTTISGSERGIFYATVSASNGVQSIEYTVTLDLYNSTEAIEYESFGHADSSYAVKMYYYLSGALSTKSYDYLVKNFTVESGNGMVMNVGDGYVSLKAHGDHSRDTVSDSVKALTTVYGGDPTGTVYYLAIDQATISAEGPLVHEIGNATTAINIYVTPRHTKDYYEMYVDSSDNLLKYAYAAGWSKGQSKRYSIIDINEGAASVKYKDAWSANWQSWAYTEQKVTLAKFIANYDAFCGYNFPIYISEDPHGRTSTDLNNGVAKLGSMIF